MKTALALALPAALWIGPAPTTTDEPPDIVLAVAEESQREPSLRVDVDSDGTIHAEGRVRWRPEQGTDGLIQWLSTRAAHMRKAPVGPGGMELPDERVLLRVDQNAPFRSVQKLMESCGRMGVLLWKIELATQLPFDQGPGVIPVHLPMDAGAHQPFELPGDAPVPPIVEKAEIKIRVQNAGEKRMASDPSKPWDGTGRFEYVNRSIFYEFGPLRTLDLDELWKRLDSFNEKTGTETLTIDARKGVVQGDVIAALDTALAARFTRFTFVGSYE